MWCLPTPVGRSWELVLVQRVRSNRQFHPQESAEADSGPSKTSKTIST